MHDLAEQEALYSRIGFTDRVGFGRSPALLIVDMCRGITEPTTPLFIDMSAAIPHIRSLAKTMRSTSRPVIYTTVAYSGPLDGWPFVAKIPLLQCLTAGSPLTEIDARLAPSPGDHLITKKYPSAFCGTHLHSLLTAAGVDTIVIVGNSTSGCVRASVIDAMSAGYRVIVPTECVADRAPLSHLVNLFDMDSKYADVVPISEVYERLNELDRLV
jgi:nicotinamidase-related amidase